jgi:competence protein ComEC
MFMLAGAWLGLLLAARLPADTSAVIALLGGLVAALAVVAGRRASILILATGFFLAGVLRSPELHDSYGRRNTCLQASGLRLPVVLRVRLPFLLGQCEENVRAEVEEVCVGDPALCGAKVILRGIDHDGRKGQRFLTLSGTFYPPRPPGNFMVHDMRRTYLRTGVAGSVRVDAVMDEVCASADRTLASIRRRVRQLIEGVPEAEARGVLEATLLGIRSGLLPEVKSTMVRAGTYHVLAISGLHVGVLVFIISILATVMRLRRVLRVVVSLALVFSYVVFTGARPSAMRAGTLFLVLSLARLLEYKTDYPNAVCFAGAVLLLSLPHLAWDLGFRLSFGAVFGMTLFLPGLMRAVPRRSRLFPKVAGAAGAGLLATFSAQLLTAPIILWSFGRISLLAGISNLLVLPVMSLSLTAGVEGALVGGISPGLGSVFMRSASVLVVLALRLAEGLTAGFNPVICPGRPHIVRVVVYYCAVLAVGLAGGSLTRTKRLAALGAAFALLLTPLPSPGGGRHLDVTFLYVGNGDACVIEVPDGRAVVVDTGAASRDYDAAESVVLPYLALRGIGQIDKLIITHSHNDHYGGIPAIVGNLAVGEILVGTTHGESSYTASLARAVDRGVPVRVVGAGETWKMGEVGFEVLHPGRYGGQGVDPTRVAGGSDDPNAWSLVIRVTFGEHSVLLTGDLTPAAQDSLVARGVGLECDILKVPHHGHPGETSAAFAEAVSASLAVISCGAKYFAEPDSSTKALLEGAGTVSLSTRTRGAVRISTDGRNLSVHTALGGSENLTH